MKESIMAMDLRRNYARESAIKTRKKIEKDVKVVAKCPECDYKTFVQTEFKRHTFRMHSKVKLKEPKSIDKVKPCKAEEVKVHPVTNISPATTDNTGEQSVEVKPSCVTCRFECNYKSELDTHMLMVHQVPRPNPRAVHPDGNHCQDCKTKEDVIMEHIQKVERLELENLNIQTDLDASKAENKLLTEQKNSIEKEYQEAGRTISQQQKKLTETNEILKTMDNLAKIDGEKRAIEKPSDRQEVWEEVWEDKDDESGNLVRQRRKEINRYQWKPDLACKKCDKVLESDQHLIKHIKEHNRLTNEMLKCHYCDFITNDEVIHTNHVVDTHSARHTCQTCGVVFPSKHDMIEHANHVHGFIYSSTDTAKSSNNLIDCHDCEYKCNNKLELMKHKRDMHFKI